MINSAGWKDEIKDNSEVMDFLLRAPNENDDNEFGGGDVKATAGWKDEIKDNSELIEVLYDAMDANDDDGGGGGEAKSKMRKVSLLETVALKEIRKMKVAALWSRGWTASG